MHAWSPEWWWLAYLALGLVVGFFAGMLGIGGGVIIVPLLVFLFTAQHFPAERVLHLALGTSLASIVFTNLSSVRAHHLRGGVRWDIVRAATPAIVAGTFIGTLLRRPPALALSRHHLHRVRVLFVAADVGRQQARRDAHSPRQARSVNRRLCGGSALQPGRRRRRDPRDPVDDHLQRPDDQCHRDVCGAWPSHLDRRRSRLCHHWVGSDPAPAAERGLRIRPCAGGR